MICICLFGRLGVALPVWLLSEVKIFLYIFVAYAVFFLVYLLLLLLFKSEYKHTGKSYRSFYHYWTLSDKAKLQIIEMNLSILNKWIRMGLFSPF